MIAGLSNTPSPLVGEGRGEGACRPEAGHESAAAPGGVDPSPQPLSRKGRGAALALLAALLFAPPALAVNPSEMLADPKLEERAREVSKGLRCLVCQNQSIDDSDAELARDLRVVVRERIKAGDSNEDVEKFVVERYGDYVLLKPPFKGTTFILWFGPLVLFLIAIGVLVNFYRRRGATPAAVESPARLTADEEKRLKQLLGDNPSS